MSRRHARSWDLMSASDRDAPRASGRYPTGEPGRREFLRTLGSVGMGSLALGLLPSWARETLAAAGAPADLIERNDWPQHWETSLEALGRSWITSNDRFFVRSHFTVPKIEVADWRLKVSGLVRTPLTLDLAELRALPETTSVHTLECAGNGRGLYRLPSTSGTQWEYGAVGNARWGGLRLAALLERAGPTPEARHVWFEAADRATLPIVPPFLRSIPIEKAMADTLLAWSMNGEPLPALHGAPLRAIVPGWFGMASTKWVTGIRVEGTPSDNHFMVKGYRWVYPGEDPATAPPVEGLVVKSVITRPLDGAHVPLGRVRVEGLAWAGSAGLKQVEISSDAGHSWRPAAFVGESAALAWRRWGGEVEARKRGPLRIMARATDGAGVSQPLEARPNASGYGNNSIHQVTFRVGA